MKRTCLMLLFVTVSSLSCYQAAQIKTAMEQTNEIRAITQLNALVTANALYLQKNGKFAAEGVDLGKAGLMSKTKAEVLDAGTMRGYNFFYTGFEDKYTCYANPQRDLCGTRSFFIDQTGEMTYIENRTSEQHEDGGADWDALK